MPGRERRRAKGEITDRRHPQAGRPATGKILVMPAGRGSSSSSTVLAEAIRLGSAPAGIILREPDGIVLLGALVAEELYGITCPVAVAEGEEYERFVTGETIELDAQH